MNYPNPETVPVSLINTKAALAELDRAINGAQYVAVDTETHDEFYVRYRGSGPHINGALRVASYAVKKQDQYKAFVVDFRDIAAEDLAPIHAKIHRAFSWNADFDEEVCRLNHVPVGSWWDGKITDALMMAGVPGFTYYKSLAVAVKQHLGLEMSGKGTTQLSYTKTPDLTDEQVRYAAHDAVLTMFVNETLNKKAERVGLARAVTLDQEARPFIAQMMENGIPLDGTGWMKFLNEKYGPLLANSLVTLRDATGGGAMTLFGDADTPTWNPASSEDAKTAFNKYIPELVKAANGGRLFIKADKLDKGKLGNMKQIASTADDALLTEQAKVVKALLEFREASKQISTYGEEVIKLIDEKDGRIRPIYKQSLTATGRLASEKPNAQNLSPYMKDFVKPVCIPGDERPRILIHGDLSQAELRVLSHLAGEQPMIDMFVRGGDFHAQTAGQMFKTDMEALEASAPKEYSTLRKKAKGVNFGIPYGLGAVKLADNLTIQSGVKTSAKEAQDMLDAYNEAYKCVAAWLGTRDGFVRNFASAPPEANWALTLSMWHYALLIKRAQSALKSQRKSEKKYRPTSAEVAAFMEDPFTCETKVRDLMRDYARQKGTPEAEVQLIEATPENVAKRRKTQTDYIDRVLMYPSPVVMGQDGTPIQFESRTESGRRRVFQLLMGGAGAEKHGSVAENAFFALIGSTGGVEADFTARFFRENRFVVPTPPSIRKGKEESEEDFRERKGKARNSYQARVNGALQDGGKVHLRNKLVLEFFKANPQAGCAVLNKAMSDLVRAMGPMYRNAPIQSGVSDVVLQAYADLYKRLRKYENCWPVQSVHDSIVIECYEEDAREIARELKEALEQAMSAWNPTVPAKADTDIRRSLADADVLSEEEVAAL